MASSGVLHPESHFEKADDEKLRERRKAIMHEICLPCVHKQGYRTYIERGEVLGSSDVPKCEYQKHMKPVILNNIVL